MSVRCRLVDRLQPDIFTFIQAVDDKARSETVLTTIHGIPGVRATETHVVAEV